MAPLGCHAITRYRPTSRAQGLHPASGPLWGPRTSYCPVGAALAASQLGRSNGVTALPTKRPSGHQTRSSHLPTTMTTYQLKATSNLDILSGLLSDLDHAYDTLKDQGEVALKAYDGVQHELQVTLQALKGARFAIWHAESTVLKRTGRTTTSSSSTAGLRKPRKSARKVTKRKSSTSSGRKANTSSRSSRRRGPRTSRSTI